MRKTILATILLAGTISLAQAQPEQRREKPTAVEMTERLHSTVELSKDQYNTVLSLNEELIQKMEEAGGPEADRETRKQIRKEHRIRLHSVLSEEQIAILKEHRKEHHKRHRREVAEPSEG